MEKLSDKEKKPNTRLCLTCGTGLFLHINIIFDCGDENDVDVAVVHSHTQTQKKFSFYCCADSIERQVICTFRIAGTIVIFSLFFLNFFQCQRDYLAMWICG